MTCLCLHRIARLVAVVFAIFQSVVRASYYLDDTDSSITYVGNWSRWSRASGVSDYDRYYNGTVTNPFFPCDDCAVTIPFKGSGIALYAAIAYVLSFNVSIDGGTPTYYHFDGISPPRYNFTAYNITSLSLSDHVLHWTVLNRSYLFFDYALVDTPSISPSSYILPIHPSTTSAVIPSTKPTTTRSIIGPAIGGTVGGIVVISTAILILFCMRRRTRRRDPITIDSDANIQVSSVDHIPIVGAGDRRGSVVINPDANILFNVDHHIPVVGATHHPGSKDMAPSNLSMQSSSNPVIEQPPQSHDTLGHPNPHVPHSSSTILLDRPLPVSTPASGGHISTSTADDAGLTALGLSSALDSDLAAEEARFLLRLYDRNAPAAEIAEFLRVMRLREEASRHAAQRSSLG